MRREQANPGPCQGSSTGDEWSSRHLGPHAGLGAVGLALLPHTFTSDTLFAWAVAGLSARFSGHRTRFVQHIVQYIMKKEEQVQSVHRKLGTSSEHVNART